MSAMDRALLLSVGLLASGLACKDSRPVPVPPPAALDAGSSASQADCSARGLSPTPAAAQPPLPPAVESMRRRIVAAAVACDYAALGVLADEGGKGLRFTFGPDENLAAFWRAEESRGVPTLARLVKLLSLPSFIQKDGDYCWPTAYRDNPIDEDYVALKGIFPAEQVEAMRRERSYLFLRVGINKDGDWEFAVSGD